MCTFCVQLKYSSKRNTRIPALSSKLRTFLMVKYFNLAVLGGIAKLDTAILLLSIVEYRNRDIDDSNILLHPL